MEATSPTATALQASSASSPPASRVLLGFIIFLAFTSYDDTKQGAETEAQVVAQQFETAQFMPAAQRQELSDGLVCYARYVVHRAWPRLEAGTEGDRFNPWGVSMFRTLQQVKPNGPTEEAAFSKWLDQNSERTAARQDRIHAAQGVVPTPLWIVLFLTAGVIGMFMLFFADSGEPGEDAGAAGSAPSSPWSPRRSSCCRSSTTRTTAASARSNRLR